MIREASPKRLRRCNTWAGVQASGLSALSERLSSTPVSRARKGLRNSDRATCTKVRSPWRLPPGGGVNSSRCGSCPKVSLRICSRTTAIRGARPSSLLSWRWLSRPRASAACSRLSDMRRCSEIGEQFLVEMLEQHGVGRGQNRRSIGTRRTLRNTLHELSLFPWKKVKA